MFESLSDKLAAAFKKFRSKGKLTEADVKAGMREIKLALLEADVNFKVVRDFVKTVTERAVGSDVLESLVPAQQIVKIVNEELTSLMGGTNAKLTISPKPPTVVMMCGLQGSGKTTHSGKLALMYKKQGKRPLLVACDVYRPAAIKQLETLGAQIDVPVFSLGDKISPVEIAKAAVEHAKKNGNDMVFLDTAGRLQIDEVLMAELKKIKDAVNPTEILLVVNAMIGQESVNVAETFNNLLDITGVILTMLDGDTRGGAALSVRCVTGKPIKFVGTGEKMDAIEPFHPERIHNSAVHHAGNDHLPGTQIVPQGLHGNVKINGVPAGKNIHRRIIVFRPGVNGKVRFADNNNTAHPLRGEGVKTGLNNRSMRPPGGLKKDRFHAPRIGKDARIAIIILNRQLAAQ